MKKYSVVDLSTIPPIEFEMGGETFRVPRKQRPDVVSMLAAAITLDEHGNRHYRIDAIRSALIVMMAREVYVDGEWVEVDDGVRFITMMNSPRVEVTEAVLGDLCWDLLEEISGIPTGAPRPSWDGRMLTVPTPMAAVSPITAAPSSSSGRKTPEPGSPRSTSSS